MLFTSSGNLHYNDNKLVLNIDQNLSNYYYSLIPKYIILNKQRYSAHVSVVRKEIPSKMEFWGKYEGKEIEFYYDNMIQHGKVYYWLNVFCKELEKIRLELGLPVMSKYTLPPDGYNWCFHMTIGNNKEI